MPYELRHVAMDRAEHHGAAYLAVNPNHQVPTLMDGDFTIYESNAILRYLCHKHDLESSRAGPGNRDNFANVAQMI